LSISLRGQLYRLDAIITSYHISHITNHTPTHIKKQNQETKDKNQMLS